MAALDTPGGVGASARAARFRASWPGNGHDRWSAAVMAGRPLIRLLRLMCP